MQVVCKTMEYMQSENISYHYLLTTYVHLVEKMHKIHKILHLTCHKGVIPWVIDINQNAKTYIRETINIDASKANCT